MLAVGNDLSDTICMNIREARENIVEHLIEAGQFGDTHYWVLETGVEPGLKSMMLSRLAGRLSMWTEAEVLAFDPAVKETILAETDDWHLRQLGIQAAYQGEYDQARSFFSKMKEQDSGTETHIVDGLLKNGKLDEAEALLRKHVDFTKIENGGLHIRLRTLVYHLCQIDGGPKRALDLVTELVPHPEESGIEDKNMERSRWDYFLEDIPALAMVQGDRDTAQLAIDLAYDMHEHAAAMGGGGILDQAYLTENPDVIEAIKTMIDAKLARTETQ
jgi:hypothetical protein